MSIFQIILFAASAFFAYRIYQHIQTLNTIDKSIKEEELVQIEYKIDFLARADEEFKKGNLKEALSLLEDANSAQRYNPEILFKLGFVLNKLKRDDEALRYLNDSLEVGGDDEFTHNLIASIYRQRGDFESAKTHFEKSLLLNENNAITHYNYGNLLVDLKLYNEAKLSYKRALEIDSSFIEAKEELEKLGSGSENSTNL